MKKLKQALVVALMTMVIGVGVFGQKGQDDKRPPKEKHEVPVKEKERQPPNNQGKDNGDKRRKP
jgi:hypothetical protein